ncbi:[4Fe-4S] proteins maturation [Tulasnella sp. 330]|nr:[4Fe-4S] proteins maturation [Tulasnella sp. 330]
MSLRTAFGFATRANLVKPTCATAGPYRGVRAISTTLLVHTLPPSPRRPVNKSKFQVIKRAASTNTATAASSELPPGGGESVLVASPPREDLEKDEVDVEALLGQDATIRITERAAEQLRTICTREHDPNVALRLAVDSGGCHGYQYKIELTSLAPDGTAKGDL